MTKLCAKSTNGRYHNLIIHNKKFYYSCIRDVGNIQKSKIEKDYFVNCQNCLRELKRGKEE